MTLRATFIGIDDYLDPSARNLSGAKRDATALWSLFSDTVTGATFNLLVDEQATFAAVTQALDESLGNASAEDTVIVSFAGHGTQDHRLVLHDTRLIDLAKTTIPMNELAKRFKDCKAKAILCILDCCFSGAAPARVMEDSPKTRESFGSVAVLAGDGRILIAACKDDEVALEHPRTRHGLLTNAILNVLQSAEESVCLIEASAEILKQVQPEAQRMGYTQTPVFLGHVEGGLYLPSLKPGDRFHQAFPERRGVKVSHCVTDLAAFGIPNAVIDTWRTEFPNGLNQLQQKAINENRVLDGESTLVVAPTSSGKTFIGEMSAARAVIEGRRAVFLFPYKALVNEKYEQFSRLYGEKLGWRISRCSGDYQDQTSGFVRAKYDLCLLTYEMFLQLVLAKPGTLNQIGLVVLDEAQFITDPSRGIVVELLLTYLVSAREQGIEPQIIALSAVIGALNEFDKWSGCKALVTTERPVPLTEGVLDRFGQYQFRKSNDETGVTTLLDSRKIVQRRDKPNKQDIIVPLLQQRIEQNKNERIIVFRNNRGAAEGCAKYLAKDLSLPAANGVLSLLPTRDLSTTSRSLHECLNGGTAFHNANLTREERAIVERAYRDKNGEVRVLGATTTVAAGINTPSSTVILAEKEFVGEDGRPFTVAEYKNMAGRAGRLGFNEEGHSIILADTPTEREQLFAKYVLGEPEALKSSFQTKDLETWVLRLLAQVKEIGQAELSKLLANTFGGYLLNRHDPLWNSTVEQALKFATNQLLELGLLEFEDGKLRLTPLGRASGRSSLAFPSVRRLIGILTERSAQQLSAFDLLVLVQGLEEMDGVHTPVMKRGQSSHRWPRDVAKRFGQDVARFFQRNAREEFSYQARCKRALVLDAWIAGRPVEEIEEEYSANPYQGKISLGNIRSFADATRFHLRSGYQIASLLLFDKAPAEDAIETLLTQLEFGLPANLLALLELPVELSRGEYLILGGRGFSTVEAIQTADLNLLKELVGEEKSESLRKV